jgi:hypothetical protein
MRILRFVTLGALATSLLASGAFAAEDKAAKQAEVQKKTEAALERFYKAKPELKEAAAKAPGYGIFTTYGFSFVDRRRRRRRHRPRQQDQARHVHERRRRQRRSAARRSQTEVLIVFKTAAAMNNFITRAGRRAAPATASAGAAVRPRAAARARPRWETQPTYTMTKNGPRGRSRCRGAKFWKDKDLN